MNKAKAAGTWAESKVRDYLKGQGFPFADRLTLTGRDRGDVRLGDGLPVTVEVKNEKKLDISGYIHELEAEMRNGQGQTGVVIIRRRGTTDVGRWYAVTTVDQHVELWRRAGYTNRVRRALRLGPKRAFD